MRRVGVIGGGQLGQMLGFAGRSIGVECVFLDPSPDAPAGRAGRLLVHGFDDVQALRELAALSELITYEFENVPVGAVEAIGPGTTIRPPTTALKKAQDRLEEKQLFRSLGIPTPDFCRVDSPKDLDDAATELGYPLVLKTRRLGYDGKGQRVLRAAADLAGAWHELGQVPMIVERLIPFDYEISIIGARSATGETAFYPLTENRHRDGILRTSRAPAGTPTLERAADEYLDALLDALDYVGVITLELFVTGERLLANEFAPRVHNSGHWTIEGARTSQFENHLRAILGMPLGATSMRGYVAMENLIGRMPGNLDALRSAGYFVHDYGKEPRGGRKLGHITLVAEDAAARDSRLRDLRQALNGRTGC